MTTVPAVDMARLLTALRDEFGGSVEALLVAARRGVTAGERRRRSPEPVPIRTSGELLDAVRLKLVTREEARRLLGLRTKTTRAASRSRAVAPLEDAGAAPLLGWRREAG